MRNSVITTLAVLASVLAWACHPAAAQAPREVRIVAFGDSLTAGYQLPPADAFPVKLQAALRAAGETVVVENAGVSGDTSTGGLDRLDWSIGEGIDAVILALGANDALRGIDPAITRRNLEAMVERLKARGIAVLLVGMLAPPNMGPQFGAAYNPIFPDLAARFDVPLYPFFLEGVATVPGLSLADGMHPNGRGVDIMVAGILPQVRALIAQVRSRRGG